MTALIIKTTRLYTEKVKLVAKTAMPNFKGKYQSEI